MQNKKISSAYDLVGRFSNFYDGMITNSSFFGRLAMKIFWGLSDADYQKFLRNIFIGMPENFCGKLLEVPIGTGIISLPIYKKICDAEIFALDYSKKMLDVAKNHAEEINLQNIKFFQGDVGKLPFDEKIFEIVLSINGLHVFPEKNLAQNEIFRVLKDGGIFCGSCYIFGKNWRTDFFVKNFCVKFGYFTPPFETAESLQKKISRTLSRSENFCREIFCVFCLQKIITQCCKFRCRTLRTEFLFSKNLYP